MNEVRGCSTALHLFSVRTNPIATRLCTHANTFCALQHDFVRVQTRFTLLQHDFVRVQTRFAPCNTISYACKHVLHRCNSSFGGQYGHYIVAATDSGVRMAITSLQQLIRRSEWPLHHCNNAFGGQNGRYIVAATDLGVRMAFYIVATAHSVVRTGFF